MEEWENLQNVWLSGSSSMGYQNDKLSECVSGESNHLVKYLFLSCTVFLEGYSFMLLPATRHHSMLSGLVRRVVLYHSFFDTFLFPAKNTLKLFANC